MDEHDKIIRQFLSEASQEDLDELGKLLEEKQKKNVPGAINFKKTAETIASQIQTRMGLTNINIMQTARDLVASIALKHNPELTEQELKAIADNMVPARKTVKLPWDLLMIMIDQFVSYGTGQMSAVESRDLPDGWVNKYWDAFPETIQQLISAYLKNEITEMEFRKAVKFEQ